MLTHMLDTAISIYTIKHRPEKVRRAFNEHLGQLCISAVTLAELTYGAEKSTNPEQNLRVIASFAARLEVLPFDEDAANSAGRIRAHLAIEGATIGAFDELIAGHAICRGLTLVTNNQKHFMRVPELKRENWA